MLFLFCKGNKELIIQTGINIIKIGNISQIYTFNKYEDIYICGDLGLNVYNSFTLDYYVKLGLKSIALSPELSLNQIKELSISQKAEYECIVYGKLPLMISEAKLFNMKEVNSIQDRKRFNFSVRINDYSPHTVIYNSVPIFFTEGIKELKDSGINIFRLLFTDENIKECSNILKIYNNICGDNNDIHNINKRIEEIKRKGFTNGHFKKGV